MSGRPNFNRTRNDTRFPSPGERNDTRFPPPWERNQSNDSDFWPNRDNDSRHRRDPSDESPEIIFYLLITLLIPSIICFLFLFYNFLRLSHLRLKSSNFLIICLLSINFIHLLVDLPFRLYFFSQNEILIKQSWFCRIWTWYDNILTTADLFIMAFTSIERYLSVFHHIFLRHHKRSLYLPSIFICFAVPTIWYTSLIFAHPCRQQFMYFTFQCGTLCYLTNSSIFNNVENMVFFMFPLLVIVVGNIALIISVMVQKASMKRRRRLALWRNNLRMISQLMFIAILYMSIYVPSCILLIFGTYVQRSRFQPWAASVRLRYFTHLKYLVIYGCPFVILAGQPELHQKIRKFFSRTRRPWRKRWKTQTMPMTTVMNGTVQIKT